MDWCSVNEETATQMISSKKKILRAAITKYRYPHKLKPQLNPLTEQIKLENTYLLFGFLSPSKEFGFDLRKWQCGPSADPLEAITVPRFVDNAAHKNLLGMDSWPYKIPLSLPFLTWTDRRFLLCGANLYNFKIIFKNIWRANLYNFWIILKFVV